MADDYDVGYGKPPRHTQFQPGQSGNPRGRPKTRTSVQDMLREVLLEPIEVREDGVAKRLPRLMVMLKKQMNKAIQNDPKAVSLIVKLLPTLAVGRPVEDGDPDVPDDEREQALLAEVARMMDVDPATLFTGDFGEAKDAP